VIWCHVSFDNKIWMMGLLSSQVLMNALDLTSVFQFGERSGELTCKVPLIYIYI